MWYWQTLAMKCLWPPQIKSNATRFSIAAEDLVNQKYILANMVNHPHIFKLQGHAIAIGTPSRCTCAEYWLFHHFPGAQSNWLMEQNLMFSMVVPMMKQTWLGKLPTCRRHVAATARCWHIWPACPCHGNTKLIPTQYFCVGDCQHSPLSS